MLALHGALGVIIRGGGADSAGVLGGRVLLVEVDVELLLVGAVVGGLGDVDLLVGLLDAKRHSVVRRLTSLAPYFQGARTRSITS